MKKELTIIIPTHNRRKHLSRVLDYYADYDVKIIVIDSSNEKDVVETEHVEYRHVQNMEYFEKLFSVVNEVKTKYILFCPDDDFIVKKSIDRCMDFLNDNQDYASVQGNYIYYTKAKDNILSAPFHFEAYNMDINESDALDRLDQLSLPVKIFMNYALHRTENIKQIYKLINDHNIKETIFGGYICQFIPVLNGKHKVLPIFYMAREWDLCSGGYGMKSLEDILMQKDGEEIFQKYKNILIEYIVKHYNRDFVKVEQFINDMYARYLNTNYSLVEQSYKNENNYLEFIKNEDIDYRFGLEGFPVEDKEAMSELNKIISVVNNHKTIYNKLLKTINIMGDKLYIYGAGLSALILFDLIKKTTSYKVLGFIDDFKTGKIDDINIFKLKDILNTELILVSPTKYQNMIKQNLERRAYNNFILIDSSYFGN